MDTRIGIENDNRTFKSSRRDSSPPLHVLYYDISGYNSSAQFLLCCTGVLVFYLIYGYLQVGLGLNVMLIILSQGLICIFNLHVLMHFLTCQINWFDNLLPKPETRNLDGLFPTHIVLLRLNYI